jgi:leucyl aminopeptidase
MAELYDRELTCLADALFPSLPVHAVRPEGLADFLSTLLPSQAAYLNQTGFGAQAGAMGLIPGPEGLAGAVLGLGDATGPSAYAALANLPAGTEWHLAGGWVLSGGLSI